MEKINFGNLTIHYNDPHDVAAIVENLVLDVYDRKEIHSGDIVIDLGAGIGEFSLTASKIVGPNGKVIAIEPSPEDFQALLLNLTENNCQNVIPLNMAVSNRSEALKLKFKGKTFECKANSLGNILSNLNINVDAIKFMKMDIEGAERDVIPSNLDLIKGMHFLAMEIHNGYSHELIPIMASIGFTFRRLKRFQYLVRTVKTALFNPLETYSLYKAFRNTGELSRMNKLLRGIEISNSDDLVVGVFHRIPRG